MKNILLGFILCQNTFANTYFATHEIQSLAKEAFILSPKNHHFAQILENNLIFDAENLINEIRSEHIFLHYNIINFDKISLENKIKSIYELFEIQTRLQGGVVPELVIQDDIIKGEAYFKFELSDNGAGTVYLNPKAIMKDPNPYNLILLALHETRHSYQLQLAKELLAGEQILGDKFYAAFDAQIKYKNEIKNFCDFLTLNHEYEAFKFANFVIGRLTQFNVSTLGMGTLLGQFDKNGKAKINILDLFQRFESGEINDSILDEFNRLEKVQYDILYPSL